LYDNVKASGIYLKKDSTILLFKQNFSQKKRNVLDNKAADTFVHLFDFIHHHEIRGNATST